MVTDILEFKMNDAIGNDKEAAVPQVSTAAPLPGQTQASHSHALQPRD